ncbi:DUF397 domain-containing protein [Nocardiopsis exhalans]|uniref:DUF397 domain-containing protein n=2 Tax=Nocardiopsis TaxID=2013 RepID=A0A840WDP9_9ACTN|nr:MULTISPECIES: DUF397 domain-containing protein [Nocardiopsis]MBB5494302.1 hypothetical protein [Nocardiopsis metallicus]QRN81389.1 MAG: DUF397 domain-containing protein [Nocardiopsis sp. BM-2018]USY20623.1 DUF397 domain-containing protein [Nocardiopsis exhalans]
MSAPHTPAHTSWHKSSYSTNGGDCVEVAEGHKVLIRDTQHREDGHLSFRSAEWFSLLSALKL